ncbi:MAG: ABC transporter permease [Atopobiaceae bacterium]|jgi:putative spermidine/putrescine transport system permease protein
MASEGKWQHQHKRTGIVWARAIVALEIICVAAVVVPLIIWSCASAWAWPDLLPASTTLRGFRAFLQDMGGSGAALLAQSVGLSCTAALLTTAAATLAARALVRSDWRGKQIFEFSTLIPFLVPGTVFAMGVQVIFIRLGLTATPLGVILAHAVVCLPYAVGIMVDITRALGTRYDEAAQTLGANSIYRLRFVTLPLLAPGLSSSFCMCYIVSFSQYFLTLLVGAGRVKTFATVMFPYLSGGDRTIIGAYAVVFLLVNTLVYAVFELGGKRVWQSVAKDLYAR